MRLQTFPTLRSQSPRSHPPLPLPHLCHLSWSSARPVNLSFKPRTFCNPDHSPCLPALTILCLFRNSGPLPLAQGHYSSHFSQLQFPTHSPGTLTPHQRHHMFTSPLASLVHSLHYLLVKLYRRLSPTSHLSHASEQLKPRHKIMPTASLYFF